MNETLFHILLILLALYLCLFVAHRIATREYRKARKLTRQILRYGIIPSETLTSIPWANVRQTQFIAGVRDELRAFEAKTRVAK